MSLKYSLTNSSFDDNREREHKIRDEIFQTDRIVDFPFY